MATESPANGVSTTLSAAITNTATALSLTSATGFPNGQYTCLLSDGTNAELVEASALSGTTLTVARASEAWGGSATAYAFGIGTKVTIVTSVQSVIRLIQSYAAPATTVTGPDAYGAAAVVGVGTTFARADHDHGLPAAPSPTLTNYPSVAPTVVTMPHGGAVTTLVTSSSLAVGTYLVHMTGVIITGATTTSAAGGAIQAAVGTATATIGNTLIEPVWYPGIALTAQGRVTLTAVGIVTVTVAGTLIAKAVWSDTTNDAQAFAMLDIVKIG